MEREDGFYWVRTGTDWTIGEWDAGVDWWYLVGTDIPGNDTPTTWGIEVIEVGPRIERIDDGEV